MLGALPNEVLHPILAVLPIGSYVQVSAVSRFFRRYCDINFDRVFGSDQQEQIIFAALLKDKHKLLWRMHDKNLNISMTGIPKVVDYNTVLLNVCHASAKRGDVDDFRDCMLNLIRSGFCSTYRGQDLGETLYKDFIRSGKCDMMDVLASLGVWCEVNTMWVGDYPTDPAVLQKAIDCGLYVNFDIGCSGAE